MPKENCVECGKEYVENVYCHRHFGRYDKSFGSFLCNTCRWASEDKELIVWTDIHEDREQMAEKNYNGETKIQQLGQQMEIAEWDIIKTNLEKEENLICLADGGYWDKQVQTLRDDRLPLNKKQITLQTRRRSHYTQLETKLGNEQQPQILQPPYGTPGSSKN